MLGGYFYAWWLFFLLIVEAIDYAGRSADCYWFFLSFCFYFSFISSFDSSKSSHSCSIFYLSYKSWPYSRLMILLLYAAY